MRTKKTIQNRLNTLKLKQNDFESRFGYNDGHNFKDIIKELEWVLNIKEEGKL